MNSPLPAADSVLLRHCADGVLTLTLNQPQKRNALSDCLIAELHGAICAAGDDDEVRAVIIAAAGDVFCAGHNLREMTAKKSYDEYHDLFTRCSELMMAVVRCKKPVLAQVGGMATAAGCQLVASCDLAVASDQARFATPGVNIGLFCSTPMVALSRKVGRNAAMQMLLTGVPISAAAAMRIGLVNEVVAADELEKRAVETAKLIAAKPAKVVAIGKEAFYQQAEMPLADAYEFAGKVMAANMQRPEAKDGIAAFLNKRRT